MWADFFFSFFFLVGGMDYFEILNNLVLFCFVFLICILTARILGQFQRQKLDWQLSSCLQKNTATLKSSLLPKVIGRRVVVC